MRRDVKFKEQRAFRKSLEFESEESSVPPRGGEQLQVTGSQDVGLGDEGVTSVTVHTGPSVVSSPSASLGSPLVDSSHGTSAELGSRAATQGTSTGTGIGTGTGTGRGSPGTGGWLSGFPNLGHGSELPAGEATSGKRKPKWLQDTLRDVDTVGPPKRATRESVLPEKFCSYIAMVTDIIESEPSSYEEAASQQVWREAMVEEYSSIMKNDVWEVVPRLEGKSVVTSR